MIRVISAMHASLDGFIEGPDGEVDWIEHWKDSRLMAQVTRACLAPTCSRATLHTVQMRARSEAARQRETIDSRP